MVEDSTTVVVGGMITAKNGKDHQHQPADGLCVPWRIMVGTVEVMVFPKDL